MTTEPFDPTFLLGCSVSNVICSIVFGDRFDYKDQHFLTFIGLINDNFRLFSSPCAQMYNIFPHIMYYLPGPHNQIFANFEKLRALVREMAKAHQASLDPSCPRDFIDCFLLKMQQEKEDPCSFFHTDTLIMTTHNLFFAGTETISTTLRYAILILMKFPEVAAKVQEEIAQVIGPERLPSVADRLRMPYTDAVIHEVQRFADIIPMGIPHALTKDTHFRGFFFPEGTNVLPFFHSVHQDPSQFKDPGRFDPGHFLDEKGAFRRSNAFMPFSAEGHERPPAPWAHPTPHPGELSPAGPEESGPVPDGVCVKAGIFLAGPSSLVSCLGWWDFGGRLSPHEELFSGS
ncbi:Cytochrome protein, partial [Ophiophagus hannah]